MHAVERVGRGREADGVDVGEREPARAERLARGDPRELLAGLLRAADEPRHARADHRDALTHRVITATAAEVSGTPRQDWATATRASPARRRSMQARARARPFASWR